MTGQPTRAERYLMMVATCLFLATFSTTAFAQDAPSRVKQSAKAAMELAETTLAPATLERLPGAQLLRRTTGAVFSVIGKGLVLVNVDGRRVDTKLYVKFDRDAMPQLRWRTRF